MIESFHDIMTIQETSRFLRIPVSSLYKLAQEGRIPCQKVGRHWRFRMETIEKWLDENPNSLSNEQAVNPSKLSDKGN